MQLVDGRLDAILDYTKGRTEMYVVLRLRGGGDGGGPKRRSQITEEDSVAGDRDGPGMVEPVPQHLHSPPDQEQFADRLYGPDGLLSGGAGTPDSVAANLHLAVPFCNEHQRWSVDITCQAHELNILVLVGRCISSAPALEATLGDMLSAPCDKIRVQHVALVDASRHDMEQEAAEHEAVLYLSRKTTDMDWMCEVRAC